MRIQAPSFSLSLSRLDSKFEIRTDRNSMSKRLLANKRPLASLSRERENARARERERQRQRKGNHSRLPCFLLCVYHTRKGASPSLPSFPAIPHRHLMQISYIHITKLYETRITLQTTQLVKTTSVNLK